MKNNKSSTAEKPSDVLDELHALVTKAEKIVARSLKSDVAIPPSLQDRVRESRDQVSDLYSDTKDQVVAGAKSTNNAIQENPYQSLAIATGVGLLIGILAGRRGSTPQ